MEPGGGKINRQPVSTLLIARRSASRELQFHQGKPLQDGGIALPAMGSAQDRFGEGLNMAGMDRLGKRSHRGIKRDLHHRDHLGRERRMGKILHDSCDQRERLRTYPGSEGAISSRRSFMCLSLGHLLHNFSGIEWFLGVEQIAVTGPIPMRAGWGTRALERGILVKIAVVKLRQFRKLRLVEHRHAPPADIDDPIVAQLPDDTVGMHRRDA